MEGHDHMAHVHDHWHKGLPRSDRELVEERHIRRLDNRRGEEERHSRRLVVVHVREVASVVGKGHHRVVDGRSSRVEVGYGGGSHRGEGCTREEEGHGDHSSRRVVEHLRIHGVEVENESVRSVREEVGVEPRIESVIHQMLALLENGILILRLQCSGLERP